MRTRRAAAWYGPKRMGWIRVVAAPAVLRVRPAKEKTVIDVPMVFAMGGELGIFCPPFFLRQYLKLAIIFQLPTNEITVIS